MDLHLSLHNLSFSRQQPQEEKGYQWKPNVYQHQTPELAGVGGRDVKKCVEKDAEKPAVNQIGKGLDAWKYREHAGFDVDWYQLGDNNAYRQVVICLEGTIEEECFYAHERKFMNTKCEL